MTPSPPAHLMFLSAHMWGHARPMSIAISRMVKLRPVVITFPIAANVYDKAKAEILSNFQPGEEEACSRIRIMRINQGKEILDPLMLADQFLEVWNTLCNGQPMAFETAEGKQGTVDFQSEPLSAIVIDSVPVDAFNAIYKHREITPALKNLKIYTYFPVATNFLFARHGEDRIPIAEALAKQEGIPFNDAAHKVWTVPQGRVIRTPSLPPLYDHELEPQAIPLTPEFCGRVLIRAARTIQQADGIFTMDAVEFDPETAEALRQWTGRISRKVYYAGPLLSSRRNAPAFQVNGQGKEAMQFLDNKLSSSGERSVIYISFGTLFWPTDPRKLVVVFQVLLEQNVPFIISCPSPWTTIPDDFLEELKQHPNALVTKWVPQQAVLEHPALGWCLTHGGHNSVMECIHAGVPMILWPISIDQPTVAIHLTDHLDVGYELLEVRNGTGLGEIFRTGKTPTGTLDAVRAELRDVLLRAFGEDGAAKRARVLKLRERLEGAWSENGIARKEMEAFLDDACASAPAGIVAAN
ncbi:UDP-Glycosyltransferase/glycogen phosphorylase [Trametes punicea]|nr:UDP-Glycosyltransferase/glycogen phosphorylase [Trametes punicea]